MDLLSTRQAAAEAGVHPRTIIAWIRRGWLAADKLPGKRGRYRIKRSDLSDLISSQAPTEGVDLD